MDQQNLLKHTDYFSVPNNQTRNPAVQNSNLTTTSPREQPSSLWDPTSLSNDAGMLDLPSTTPASPLLGSFAQPSSADTSMSLAASMKPPPYGQSKTILPTRAPPPRTREGHERKRSKLSTDIANNIDSVDFWLEFDDNDGLGTTEGGNYSKGKDRASINKSAANPLATSTGSALATGAGMASGGDFKIEHDDGIDDSALDNALSDEDDGLSSMNLADQLSKIDSAPPTDVPPREGLYSTPLSWEKPQLGLRMDPLLSLHNVPLNESDQQRLIAIAMNPGSTTGGLGSSLASEYAAQFGSHAFGAPLMPPTTTMSHVTNIPSQSTPNFQPSTTRPSAQGSTSEKGKDKSKTGDRTAHNDIERKYRTNLKDKIAELRDSVPALRPIPENGVPDDGDGTAQLGRAPKVSKGTVLTKATEYIHFLERKNKAILREHQELSRRLQAFEQLLSATTRQPYAMPNYSRTLFDPRGFC